MSGFEAFDERNAIAKWILELGAPLGKVEMANRILQGAHLSNTPPSAPVPPDARVGDVYRSASGSFEATVSRVHPGGRYETTSAGFSTPSVHCRGEHAARGDVLIKRGPEVASEAKRGSDEARLADARAEWPARAKARAAAMGVMLAGLPDSPPTPATDDDAPTPEPATAGEMTAGERAYHAYNRAVGGPTSRFDWAAMSDETRSYWEAAALAAQPAPAAKAEREVVGWVVREGAVRGEGRYVDTTCYEWERRKFAMVYTDRKAALRKAESCAFGPHRIVRVTRAVRAKS